MLTDINACGNRFINHIQISFLRAVMGYHAVIVIAQPVRLVRESFRQFLPLGDRAVCPQNGKQLIGTVIPDPVLFN